MDIGVPASDMVTEESIFELMDDYQSNLAAAEAAYLSAEKYSLEEINENLRKRHGSGQGYADFKSDIEELTDAKIDDRWKVKLKQEDTSEYFEDITVNDVAIPLDQVIRNAFVAKNEQHIRDRVLDNLSNVTSEASYFAGIARNGYDLDLWDETPRAGNLWKVFTITTGRVWTEKQRSDIIDELIETGCFYATSGGGIRLTPMLIRIESPFEYLTDPTQSPLENL